MSLSAWSQGTYSLKPTVEGLSGVTVGALTVADVLLRPQVTGLTELQLMALSRDDVPSWDRVALGRWDASAMLRSDVVMASSLVIGSGSALLAEDMPQTWVIGTMWVEANLLNGMSTYVIKHSTRRIRPYAYGLDAPLADRMSPDAQTSFVSGHTSLTAVNTFFAATVFSQTHPDSQWVPWVWAAAAAIPAYTGYQRVQAGEHFPSDVLAGYALGAVIGYLIPTIHLD